MSTPQQMLLGFTRVEIPAGRTVTVEVAVPASRLRLYGADGGYELLHGEYELHVGGRAPGHAPGNAVGEPLQTSLRVV